MIRRTPVKRKRSKPRRGPMRDLKYRRWLTHQRCAIATKMLGAGLCDGHLSDPAHTQNNGMGSKGPDSSCAPLCRAHHQEYDAGRALFEKKYGVDMKTIARANRIYYLSHDGAGL